MHRIALGTLLATALLSGCRHNAAEETKPEAVLLGPEDTAVASVESFSTGPKLTGTLTAATQAVIRAQIGGTVTDVSAQQGESVRADQLLARIQNAAAAEGAQSATAAVTNARNNLQNALNELGRQRELYKAGIVSRRDLDNAGQNVSAARSMVKQAESQAASAQQQVGYTAVRSPIQGVVSEKGVSTGDVVQPGSALFTVIDPSSLQLEASIPTSQLSQISVGQPVEFTVNGYPNRAFTGKIARINPVADPSTREVRVYAEVPNRERVLVSGLYAEGRVRADSRKALVIPDSAIDRSMQQPAVMAVQNGRVTRIEVKLGAKDEATGRVEILNGIQPGQVVLTGAAQELTPGTIVRIKPSQGTASPA
ncbi:MAG: efflux RND transporter periplasmic adaptor subunit [Thermoanaerobaculia bacterium]